MHSPAAAISIGAIGAYQRWLSPHKGFRCAHRACTGGLSCSAYAKFALLRRGFFAALPGIRERLRQCSQYAADPRKGKISEDDPGPLSADECKAFINTLGCVTCSFVDPVMVVDAWYRREAAKPGKPEAEP